jgi:hypothetical protein
MVVSLFYKQDLALFYYPPVVLWKGMTMHEEQSPQIRRVQYWIERLESKASTLLDGLPVEEMSPKHQADVALKCLDYLQRFTSIEKTLQDAAHSSENQGLLSAFKRQARGEQSSEDDEEREDRDEVEEWNEAADEAFDEMWYGKERASEEYSAPYQEEESWEGCSPRHWRRQ